jgi:hypothetical protein
MLMRAISLLTMQVSHPENPAQVEVERIGNLCIKGRMDLPSSKLSWHKSSTSGEIGLQPFFRGYGFWINGPRFF